MHAYLRRFLESLARRVSCEYGPLRTRKPTAPLGDHESKRTHQDKWRTIPMEQWRVAVPIKDPKNKADWWINYFKLPPLEEIERLKTIRVCRPRVERTASPETTEPRH